MALSQIAGIDRFDLGIMKPGGVFWQKGLGNLDLSEVLKRFPWLRAENSRMSEIYFRPGREGAWSIIILDDLTWAQVSKLSRKYQCWVVRTSENRNHAWVLTERPLIMTERYLTQKEIARRGWGDPAAVSGDRFGRIPGFRNWKRAGEWVNLISCPDPALPRFNPPSTVTVEVSVRPQVAKDVHKFLGGVDDSESGKDFGWVCGWLRSGLDPNEAVSRLSERAKTRGKKDPEGYARRTVEKARTVL